METEPLKSESPSMVFPQPGKGCIPNPTETNGRSPAWDEQQFSPAEHMWAPGTCRTVCGFVSMSPTTFTLQAAGAACRFLNMQHPRLPNSGNLRLCVLTAGFTAAGESATAQAQNCLTWGGFKTQRTTLALLSLPRACQLNKLSIQTIFEMVDSAGIPLLGKAGMQ